MNLNNGDVYFTVPPDSGPSLTITSPASVIVANLEAYSEVLAAFPRIECPLSQECDIEKLPKIYSQDPSCFARTYSYFGQNGVTTQGLVNDAELEVPFQMPSMAKFVNYNPEDTQIARVLKLQSGGPALNMAFALTDKQFHERHLKNPIPVIYKFLDLTELYMYVATTLAYAYSSQVFSTAFTNPTPLPFSKYDFFILLRQAVLTQFGASQLQGQFLQPLNQSSGTGQKFKPLVFDPCTIPISAYNTLILPQVIHENLSMLKSCSYLEPKRGGDSPVRVTYVPVWGVYVDDELPDITYQSGESTVNLFSATSILPSYSRITDLSTGSSNIKVNPNSQQAIILLDIWNAQMNKFNNLMRTSAISGDVNISGNLLIHTRIQTSVEKRQVALPFKVQDPSTLFIKDTIQVATQTKKGTGVEVKVINVATVETTTILSPKSVPQALSNTLFLLLLPTLRADVESKEDKLTITAWQTYTGEVSAQPYATGSGQSSLNVVQRVYQLISKITTQPFAPDSTMDALATAMKQLAEHSWGADLFGQIASGLLGMIPVVGPVLGQAVQAFF